MRSRPQSKDLENTFQSNLLSWLSVIRAFWGTLKRNSVGSVSGSRISVVADVAGVSTTVGATYSVSLFNKSQTPVAKHLILVLMDAAGAFSQWMWTWAYEDPDLEGDESHGDLMEVCFNLCYMHVVLGINLPSCSSSTRQMSTWSLQWPMLHRDFRMTRMSGIADINDKHPNGPGLVKKTRLETACKYYSLISKIQVAETIRSIEGKRTHETWVNMSCKCMYCGEPIRKTNDWRTINKATLAIWTHLGTCDAMTSNVRTHAESTEMQGKIIHFELTIFGRCCFGSVSLSSSFLGAVRPNQGSSIS